MTTPNSNSPQAENAPHNHRRRFWMIVLTVIFLSLGALWFLYWLGIGRFHIYTDDAYVHGNEVPLTPQVTGGVKAIYAEETDLVQEGQLVVEIDPTDYEIQLETLKQRLANQVRTVASLFAQLRSKEAEVIVRHAEKVQAERDYQNRITLVQSGAVSREEFHTYETQFSATVATWEKAVQEREMLHVLVAGTTVSTHPTVQEIVWQIRDAYLDLIRCRVCAPATGYVAKRSAQVGDWVVSGSTLLYIVPLDEVWIEANYKETQLIKMRIGQPVHLRADMYGSSVDFLGTLVGFQPGSGNAFALLPPQNASGNWIKIIQRVPVRIALDPDQLRETPLLLGLSMRSRVDVHDTSGKRLALVPTRTPLYYTSLYQTQVEEMEKISVVINTIIQTQTALYADGHL